MEDEGNQRSQIGWGRAIINAAAVCIAGVALLVVVPNLVVTRWTALVHSARVAIAVAWFFVSLLALTWALRWMQRRRFI
jgi:hypothetical protein